MDLNQKFKIYLAEKKMTLKKFSEMVDKNPTYISSIMNGRLFPGRKLIEKIEEITDKKIRYTDFIREENLKKKTLDQKKQEEQKNECEKDKENQ